MPSLTSWIDPLDAPESLQAAVDDVKAQAASISHGARQFAPSLLLPVHYGPWSQAECRQNLPDDLRCASPDDVAGIRQAIEAQDVGFGTWGVPLDARCIDDSGRPASARLAARYAAASGYYANNAEPGSSFWAPGDNIAPINDWWQGFWDELAELGATDALSGNVGVTVIANDWGLGAFRNSLGYLVAGANVVLLEAYGGPNTPCYPYPNCWPQPSVSGVQALLPTADWTTTRLVCILAAANLVAQAPQASRLGHGEIHVWYARATQ